jgi:hypothetical protein
VGGSRCAYRYSVERDLRGPGYADVALIRRAAPRGLLGRLTRRQDDAVVVFHRAVKPRVELAELEAYASQLERVAQHANDGTLGCFVETISRAGTVWITLYERWFDGHHLVCEQLAQHGFDPTDEATLVASAEFMVELEAWAEERNEEREASYLDAGGEDDAGTARAIDQTAAADELARILQREHPSP